MRYVAFALFLALGVQARADWFHRSPSLELYKEYPKPGEEAEFKTFAAKINQLQAKAAKGGDLHRGFHAKHHGCVRGELQVADNLPADLRQGVFAEPRIFPAWLRFSNGQGKVQADKEPDVRGAAIKIMDVKGKKLLADERFTQDFLMTNRPIAGAPNATVFMEFAEAVSNGHLPFFLVKHPKLAFELFKVAGRKVPSVLSETYWSGVPYRLGKKAMKYQIRPCADLGKKTPRRPSPNYLREDLESTLAHQGACFNFYVQIQTDPIKNPIEDGSVEWTEKVAPLYRVAQLRIPEQSFSSKNQELFCEQLSFTPWHTLEAHRPLGNMNRARKFVYDASQGYRRNYPTVEPTGKEKF